MKALIIGAAGFVGGNLINQLKGWDIHATKLPHETTPISYVPFYDLDVSDKSCINSLLDEIQPDVIFHLAAQSSVALSWKNPALTVDVNIKGSLNLLEGVKFARKPPRVLLVGSGEEYGPVDPLEGRISETRALHPGNIYAVTKAAQGMLGQIYAKAYGLDILVIRAFNHTGPGQTDQFVISNFCRQVANIKAGFHPPEMKVGNLEARRDFCDVRDVVRAYQLLAERGKSGEVYNVGSGKEISIQEALDLIISISGTKVTITQDPERMRPSDAPIIVADISKLISHTGWMPQIPIEKTIADMLGQ